MSRSMRSRGVSSYRGNKRSSNKLSRRLSKRRVKRSYKRSNRRSNKRLNRKSFKRVSKRMRNNRKSFRRRGGAPAPHRLEEAIMVESKRREAIESKRRPVLAKRAEGEKLMAQRHYVKALLAFAAAKALPNSHLVTDLPSLKKTAEDKIEQRRTKVICKGASPWEKHPLTGKSLGTGWGFTKSVDLFRFVVKKPDRQQYTIYHRWSEILKFIKDLEDRMKERRTNREESKADQFFHNSYTAKIRKVYTGPEYTGLIDGYVYDYINWKCFDKKTRKKGINEYFKVLSGLHKTGSMHFYHLLDFKTVEELTDLLNFASATDYANHFNTFLYTKGEPEGYELDSFKEEEEEPESYGMDPAPEPTSTDATHDAKSASTDDVDEEALVKPEPNSTDDVEPPQKTEDR